MNHRKALCPMQKRRSVGNHESGIALITALLLLLLMTTMAVAMVISVNSDMLINGYYRNFRGGFYAADSGLAIVRQSVQDQLLAGIPPVFTPGTQPIPSGWETTALSNVVAYYGAKSGGVASYNSINSGQPDTWAQSFWMDPTLDANHAALSLTNCTVTGGDVGATCANPCPTGCATSATTPTQYAYLYSYHMLVYGRSYGPQVSTLEESGTLRLTVPVTQAAGTKKSFAAWGMFIDTGNICDGTTLVPGTISGPVFTNGAWNFSTAGQYIFTGSVGSASAKAGFQFNDKCDQLAASSDSEGSGGSKVTIAPTFASAPVWGQAKLPLPTDSYSQAQAVLDGIGTPINTPGTSAFTNDMKNALMGTNAAAYAGQSTGVYMPYTYNSSTGQYNMTGGGIWVQGNASVQLSTSGSSVQIYTITQGSTTTTITIDNAAKTTVFKSGSNTVNIAGVPVQKDTSGTHAVTGAATMLYVNGQINALSGPGAGVAGIQDGTALTIAAAGNVTITGDLLYKTEPVTQTANQVVNGVTVTGPADTLIPGSDKGQMLGIFTASGDIQLNNSQSSGNLEIDATIATISSGGSGGLINTGNSINKLTIVGGRIQNQMKNINATTRNVYFDQRYANGEAPPWFPSTTISNIGNLSAGSPSPVYQRLQWVNRTAFQ